MEEAAGYASEFYLTAAGQKNRNFLQDYVQTCSISFEMEGGNGGRQGSEQAFIYSLFFNT